MRIDDRWQILDLMGQKGVKLSKKEATELSRITYFDKKEINQWYQDFMHDCPSGVLRKETFTSIYQSYFPNGSSAKFAGYVFDAYDTRKVGVVNFREFIVALSITSRGSIDEKINWAFGLYDLDQDGYISRSEMMDIVDGIYQMIGSVIDLPLDENTPEKRVDKIFKQMDVNRDGRLSRQEFYTGSRCDPWMVQTLSMNMPGDTHKSKNK